MSDPVYSKISFLRAPAAGSRAHVEQQIDLCRHNFREGVLPAGIEADIHVKIFIYGGKHKRFKRLLCRCLTWILRHVDDVCDI